jgi:hypothetical protein
MSLSQIKVLTQQFNSSVGLPFQEILKEEFLENILADLKIKYRNRIFNPIVTLWAFLSQVLEADPSCHKAVSRIIAQLQVAGEEAPSTNNSAYCQARERLPENFIKKVLDLVSKNLEKSVKDEQLWKGKKVFIFDGSTVSMPDTKANQKAYPQPSSQAEGCGFPLARIVVLFSLATGAINEIILNPLVKVDL